MAEGSGDNPLVIRKLEFIGGMAGARGWRPDSALPEIAFAGRSNVGKSSLLNRLAEPEEMGWIAAFLVSEKNSYMTGTTVESGGGRDKVPGLS